MEIAAIKAEIINKYQTLNKLAHIKPQNNIEVPYWQLRMGNWGICQSLDIWCSTKALQRKIEKQRKWEEQHPYESHWRVMTHKECQKEEKRDNYIKADIGEDRFELKIKPFWMREKRAMSIISDTLNKFIDNYNSETVKKEQVSVRIYTKEFIDHLLGKNPDFKRIDCTD
jgi:hypothetical protein